MSALSDAYERRYPGTGVGENQAEEREQREQMKDERREGRRTMRTRGIVVPTLPWKRNED